MSPRLEEIKLLAQCALADNRQAFGRLVEIHSPGLKRFLINLTHGDAALTDDLAQETFIKAYLAVREFNALSNFSTWLYRIAYNEYLIWRRKTREDALDSMPDVIDEPDEDFRAASLMEGVDRLSEPIRTIILLHYIEDKRLKDISRILDIPLNTVKVYLKRGRDRLRTFNYD